MRFAFFLAQLVSYIGFGFALLDGYTYETEGYGLHPVIATILCMLCVYGGFFVAGLKVRYALEKEAAANGETVLQ